MDWTPVIVAAIGAPTAGIPSYFAYKAAKHTRPVNGQTAPEQIDQLHRLFIVHDKADKQEFSSLHIADGELSQKILDAHTYNQDRWHKDDGRYAITLALISTLADDGLDPQLKKERFRGLYESAKTQIKWNGQERRKEET